MSETDQWTDGQVEAGYCMSEILVPGRQRQEGREAKASCALRACFCQLLFVFKLELDRPWE